MAFSLYFQIEDVEDMQKMKASKLMQVQSDGKIKKTDENLNSKITPEPKNKDDINKISKIYLIPRKNILLNFFFLKCRI